MKVLYIAHFFLPNMAAGVTTEEIIKMLLQKGHEIILVAPSTYMADDPSVYQHGSGVTLKSAFTAIPKRIAERSKFASMLISTLGYISVFIAAVRASKREGPLHLIMAQHHTFHLASSTSLLLSRVFKIPLIVKLHSFLPGSPTRNKLEFIYCSFLSKVNKTALRHATRILSLSAEWSSMLASIARLEESKMVIFPSAVDLNFFSSTEDVNELRSRLGLKRKRVVLFIAGAFEDRGLDVLIKALHTVKDKQIVLVVVGPYDEKFAQLVQQLHLGERVIFMGEVKHALIPKLIHMADVCVGPLIGRSMWYGDVPTKVIEYMACGKPVIAAEGSVTKDLVKDGVSGVLVSSNNEAELASAVVSLFNNAHLSKVIGKGARRIITERYSSEKLADRLDEVLKGSMLPNQS